MMQPGTAHLQPTVVMKLHMGGFSFNDSEQTYPYARNTSAVTDAINYGLLAGQLETSLPRTLATNVDGVVKPAQLTFYDGGIIVEVHDYRDGRAVLASNGPAQPHKTRVFLRPDHHGILTYIDSQPVAPRIRSIVEQGIVYYLHQDLHLNPDPEETWYLWSLHSSFQRSNTSYRQAVTKRRNALMPLRKNHALPSVLQYTSEEAAQVIKGCEDAITAAPGTSSSVHTRGLTSPQKPHSQTSQPELNKSGSMDDNDGEDAEQPAEDLLAPAPPVMLAPQRPSFLTAPKATSRSKLFQHLQAINFSPDYHKEADSAQMHSEKKRLANERTDPTLKESVLAHPQVVGHFLFTIQPRGAQQPQQPLDYATLEINNRSGSSAGSTQHFEMMHTSLRYSNGKALHFQSGGPAATARLLNQFKRLETPATNDQIKAWQTPPQQNAQQLHAGGAPGASPSSGAGGPGGPPSHASPPPHQGGPPGSGGQGGPSQLMGAPGSAPGSGGVGGPQGMRPGMHPGMAPGGGQPGMGNHPHGGIGHPHAGNSPAHVAGHGGGAHPGTPHSHPSTPAGMGHPGTPGTPGAPQTPGQGPTQQGHMLHHSGNQHAAGGGHMIQGGGPHPGGGHHGHPNAPQHAGGQGGQHPPSQHMPQHSSDVQGSNGPMGGGHHGVPQGGPSPGPRGVGGPGMPGAAPHGMPGATRQMGMPGVPQGGQGQMMNAQQIAQAQHAAAMRAKQAGQQGSNMMHMGQQQGAGAAASSHHAGMVGYGAKPTGMGGPPSATAGGQQRMAPSPGMIKTLPTGQPLPMGQQHPGVAKYGAQMPTGSAPGMQQMAPGGARAPTAGTAKYGTAPMSNSPVARPMVKSSGSPAPSGVSVHGSPAPAASAAPAASPARRTVKKK